MAISLELSYTKDQKGVWVMDVDQDDYDIKKEIMVPRGNGGVCFHPGEDSKWVTRLFALRYPHITLTFDSTAFDAITGV